MKLLARCAALAAALVTAGCEPDVVQVSAVEHGEMLFEDAAVAGTDLNTYSCATCHDVDPPPAGALIRPGAPMRGVTKRPSYWGGSEVELLRAVNQCLYYFMLKDGPWTPEDADAQAVYAYLESLSTTEEGTEAQPFTVVGEIYDLPAGDAGNGQGIYDRACGLCHGKAHTGEGRLVERAAVLPEETLEAHPLDKYTPDQRRLVFVEKARHGAFLGYPGQMPPFSLEKLSDAEMGDLLAFLDLY